MRQKKEYDFVVTLKHPDYKIYNIISVLMCLMTVTASAFGMLQTTFTNLSWINIFLAGVIVYNLIFSFLNRNEKGSIVTFKWALYASAFLWLLYPLNIMGISIFFIIAALLERQIKSPQEIGFSKDGITFNTFPFKNYTWQQVSNVILKDDLLTLDRANNKILQKETETEVSPETEREFNEFCKQQLLNKSQNV
ncbi:MAG: hypothetical protein ABI405_06985 [Parafilimonas sp.]